MATGSMSHLRVSFINPTPPHPYLASGTNSVGYCETCFVPIISIFFFFLVLLFLMTNKPVVFPVAR